MSSIGKTSTGFFRGDFPESRVLSKGVKTLRFAHVATVGDTSISLNSLSTPTELSANGFTNPNASDLLAAQLYTNRNNFQLESSVRGVLKDYAEYVVAGDSRINFLSPFVALDGERFYGTIVNSVRTGTGILDALQFAVTTTLPYNTTDVALGVPIPTGGVYGTQMPPVLVFRSGVPMVQNINNANDTSGNFWLVPGAATGYSTLLRFNDVGGIGGEPIIMVPIGVLPFMGTDAISALLQTQGSQIDAIVTAVNQGLGTPLASLNGGNPNYTDLRQFGDTVVSQGNRIATLETAKLVFASVGAGTSTLGVAPSNIIFSSVVDDYYGAYNATTGEFTCPSAGKYEAYMRVESSGNMGAAGYTYGVLYKNGSTSKVLAGAVATSGVAAVINGGVKLVCAAGDKLNFGGSWPTTQAITNSALYTWATFTRIGN